MSISPSFDTGALRIRLKTAEDKVKAFESGEKYVQMQEQFKAVFREQNARIRNRQHNPQAAGKTAQSPAHGLGQQLFCRGAACV